MAGGTCPYAFTEEGVAMLSSVLAGERAAAVNVLITRAFVQLRRAHLQYVDLRQRIEEVAQKAVDVTNGWCRSSRRWRSLRARR